MLAKISGVADVFSAKSGEAWTEQDPRPLQLRGALFADGPDVLPAIGPGDLVAYSGTIKQVERRGLLINLTGLEAVTA